MNIKDYIILGLLVACAVLWLTRGCGRSPLGINDCPEPTVIEKIVKVKGEVEPTKPVAKPRETVEPIPITKPFLVATFEDKGIYINPKDTAAIVSDYFVKREYEENLSDSNITATAKVTVQANRLQDISLQYEFEKEKYTTLYDRFQFHTLASGGLRSDFNAKYRLKIGAGALMEFKTGTGVGAMYQHAILAEDPHSVEILISQRLSFRRRR